MPKVAVNGIELAYETYGEGFPLVLAHGWLASKEMWDAQIGPFSEKYRVVVYDIRGHGESDAPNVDNGSYTLETFVEDQRALMAHLGIEQAYVGGLSMGGMIAMRFALQHPTMTRALMLFDTAAGTAPGLSGAHREVVEGIVRAQGVVPVMRALYANLPEAQRIRNISELPAGVQRYIDRLEGVSVEGAIGGGRAMADMEPVLERLPELRMPVMVLVGDQDVLRGPSEEMKAKLPDARFVLIKDSTHGTCLWQPEAFTSATLDFLADVEAGQPVAGREER